MLGAGPGVFNWCAEALPKNADDDVRVLDAKDGVDEALWTFEMETGIGIGLPTDGFQA